MISNKVVIATLAILCASIASYNLYDVISRRKKDNVNDPYAIVYPIMDDISAHDGVIKDSDYYFLSERLRSKNPQEVSQALSTLMLCKQLIPTQKDYVLKTALELTRHDAWYVRARAYILMIKLDPANKINYIGMSEKDSNLEVKNVKVYLENK